MFLEVSSVSTSFTWNQRLFAEAFKFEPSSSDTHAGVRGTLDYTERPTITYTPLVDDLLDIKSQPVAPSNAAIAVQYRDSWFYVDDSDIDSKYTFMLLRTLMELHREAVSAERGDPGWKLDIPRSGTR